MEKITVDIGVYTALSIDLTDFDFTGIEKLIFTIKNKAKTSEPVIVTREFDKPALYNIEITPDESYKLQGIAVYDFVKIIEGKPFKATDNGEVILRVGVGQCQ